ncbi:NAD(P)H-dependent oxidoreductase [Rhodopseudomonas sp.]|uniref:NAD(P)H-dependent oxidoreductase n=1 Tax=Rhodopseudomonas sp. TaxID=1078 RepID=UPI003B3AB3C4
MRAHIVLAHPEPGSYNGHLAATARQVLAEQGWSVTVSDLYAMGFDPCEAAKHFTQPNDPGRFDAQSEQRHASANHTLPTHVAEEIARLDQSDLVILQYPMWWHMPPAILKGWFDRVFAYGEIYTSRMRFENGRFKGKRAMLSVTVGTSEATYAYNGRSGDIDLMLWPVNFNLAYVGFDVVKPFVAYGVESGIRYSEPEAIEARLQDIVVDWSRVLQTIAERPTVPFNRMAEWGEDGRIISTAPSYSPFIRHQP